MESLLPLFVALTGVGIALQAGILTVMYFTLRKTSQRMEIFADEVRSKAIPAIETATLVLNDTAPKLALILENIEQSTSTLRAQVTRFDAAANDALDRGRLQVIRADELATRTLDRIEQTTDMVHKTVLFPVRQVSGVISGITAGLEHLLGNRHRAPKSDAKASGPQDEMFI
jgi:hypothetical protein